MQRWILRTLSILLLYWVKSSVSRVLPRDPILQIGTTLNLTCTVDDTDKINLKLLEFLRPRTSLDSHPKLISQTTALLQVRNVQEEDAGQYECFYNKTLQGGQLLTVGYLDAPTDVKCVFYNFEILSCSWNQGRNPLLSTTWNAYWKRRISDHNWSSCKHPEPSVPACNWTTSSENGSDTLWINDMIWIKVQAENALGTASSDQLVVYTNASLVQPAPIPSNDIIFVAPRLSWQPPVFPSYVHPVPLDYQINISLLSGQPLESHHITALSNESASVELLALHLDVYAYTITVCSKPNMGGFWSEATTVHVGFIGTYGIPFDSVFIPTFVVFLLFLLGAIVVGSKFHHYLRKCFLIPISVPKPVPEVVEYSFQNYEKCNGHGSSGYSSYRTECSSNAESGVPTHDNGADKESCGGSCALESESTSSAASAFCKSEALTNYPQCCVPQTCPKEGYSKFAHANGNTCFENMPYVFLDKEKKIVKKGSINDDPNEMDTIPVTETPLLENALGATLHKVKGKYYPKRYYEDARDEAGYVTWNT
ncbi:uncharacterized protein LOC106155587 [Lingula anatina]|uniref:Uncharacterized protein LOC106155587 n=1 Tax=Lingula anatina TaxID=7574 RepID=A0A1S3HKF5_LINAN|nr:uncharacterized protein LOC106155587 [Lingula anatina]XP_013385946.1 uncharacterized protein LOC106155587 [Lingula anatina]|eukprot:XP_013385939.1 uncharacterized protein LOC106155587 [Lingula anatina]